MGNVDETERLDRNAIDSEGCRLTVIEGTDRGAAFDLRAGHVVIGSHEGASFRLTDPTVSATHARVELTPRGIKVIDLESTNGTFYLGTQIREALVSHGAVLKLGRTRITVIARPLPPGEAYSARTSYGAIRGRAPAMRRLYALLERLEALDYGILLQGETGVGKELVAREIHNHSRRRDKPFEILDCGAVPQQLAESELFGHSRGAFTGAVSQHDGVFARADRGTVFLDEIGELPLELQPKLLRVLETRSFRPVGSTTTRNVDVRVVAATHRTLADEVRAARFREDLYFRLNVVTVRIPPLRERREDIPDLVRHFVEEAAPGVTISSDTLEMFTCGYDWPGNVRELKNAIFRVLSLGSLPDTIAPAPRMRGEHPTPPPEGERPVDLDEPFHMAKKRIVDAFERDYLSSQLGRAETNLAKAARLSGVDRSYFKRLLRRHGLLPSQHSASPHPNAAADDDENDSF